MVNLGGIACRKLLHLYIYIYIIHRHQRPIWVSLMWILEKYNDITLKRGIANLGRSHRLPCVFNNFHFPSISINKCPSNTYLVLPQFLRWLKYIYIYIISQMSYSFPDVFGWPEKVRNRCGRTCDQSLMH